MSSEQSENRPASAAEPVRRPPIDTYATRPGSGADGDAETVSPAVNPLDLRSGDVIDDFEVISLLGRGAFGTVYLARQRSLGRQVALKVSACSGLEGRSLARLDHPHIVTVYAETVHDGVRLLCMQYVPSVPLDDLLRALADRQDSWTGTDLLTAIDRSHPGAAEFDPGQLADRNALAALDHVDAVCFLGSRLADAIGHAHRQGVLHRDIKAGNVLVSQYGRPLLVDFNLAEARTPSTDSESLFGGTLPYMAPEHLDAFNPAHPATTLMVTDHADQYSLGVLVYELVAGKLPFTEGCERLPLPDRLRRMAADRRAPGRIWDDALWRREPGLAMVLARALAPRPEDRWPSADAFAAALRDTIRLRHSLGESRAVDPLPPWITRRPFVLLVLAGVLPNLAGGAVNIPYNLLRIVPAEHEPAFLELVNVYNAAVYPICLGILAMVAWPVYRAWRFLDTLPADQVDRLRDRVLGWPRWAGRIAVIGWLPAAIFFPWALHRCDGDLGWSRLGHFFISITISGLVALTYSTLLVACLVAWIFYPPLWRNPAAFQARAEHEVAPLLTTLRILPFLAGAIPLVAAILMVTASPRSFAAGEYEMFRLLTTMLIALGMAGFQFALAASGRARESLEAFTASDGPPSTRRSGRG